MANPKDRDQLSRTSSFSSSSSSPSDEEEELEVSSVISTEPFISNKPSQSKSLVDENRSSRRSLRPRALLYAALFVGPAFLIVGKLVILPWMGFGKKNSADSLDLTRFRRCTYKDLDDAFRGVISPPHHHQDRKSNETSLDTDAPSKCWSLEEEILRIPARAIDHKNLVRLGAGYKGGVYAAIIHLSGSVDSSSSDDDDKCVVAMKSDHCHSKNPFKSNWLDKRTKHSCIERDTLLLNPTSFMGAEYSGALIYHALKHMVSQNPSHESLAHRAEEGLLPTWGVVQDVGHPMRSRVKRKHLHGMPHHDPTVKAIVMPMIDFEPLSSISPAHKKELVRDTRTVARAMLSAAVGLSVMNGMRLAFRDVQSKNVGVRIVKNDTDPDGPLIFRSFMYDNSFLTYEDDEVCTLPDDQNAGCNFCPDRNFHHHRPGSNHDDLYGDTAAIRGVIVNLLKDSPDKSSEKQDLIYSLDACRSAQDIVEVLEEFQ